MSWLRRLAGSRVPSDFARRLAEHEHALGQASVSGGGHLVVTRLGLWIPDEDAPRRVGWHLISKAMWERDTLTVTEGEQIGVAGSVVLLKDRTPMSYRLENPGKVPLLVRQRVDGSIRSRHRQELDSGIVWFVYRKLPGQDGLVLQARVDPGVDLEAAVAIAEGVSAKLTEPEVR